jgi:hypothetical protein
MTRLVLAEQSRLDLLVVKDERATPRPPAVPCETAVRREVRDDRFHEPRATSSADAPGTLASAPERRPAEAAAPTSWLQGRLCGSLLDRTEMCSFEAGVENGAAPPKAPLVYGCARHARQS